MIPLLALGIPTSGTLAVLMVALLLHGVRPGPLLISEQPQMFWGLIASMYIGNLILIILNLPLVGLFVSLLRVPFRILFPMILLITIVGVYSVNLNTFDLLILLGAGVFGYLARKFKFGVPPFILALLLGPLIEETFRQSLMRSGGSLSIFYGSPIAMTLILLSCLLFLWNIFKSLKSGSQKKEEEAI
jgi:putative tricarboxylic transport membrane protein